MSDPMTPAERVALREQRINERGQRKDDWNVAEKLVAAWIESDDLPRAAFNAMSAGHFVKLVERVEHAISSATVDALDAAERRITECLAANTALDEERKRDRDTIAELMRERDEARAKLAARDACLREIADVVCDGVSAENRQHNRIRRATWRFRLWQSVLAR